MKIHRIAVVSLLALGTVSQARADDATVRPEIGKPIEKAQRLQQDGQFAAALAALRKADSISGKTPYEVYALELTRGSIASQSGDSAAEIKAFEAVIPSPYATAAQKNQFRRAIAVAEYQAKQYGEAEHWIAAYFDAGGDDPALKDALIQAYYLDGKFPEAEKAARTRAEAELAAGTVPHETTLQIWAAAATSAQDKPGYYQAIEALASHYPKPSYWTDLLHHAEAQPGFADLLSVDGERFARAAGILTDPEDIADFAQSSVQAGVPGEAVATVDWAFDRGIFGQGAQADRQKRLKAFVAGKAAADRKGLPEAAKEAANLPTGDALVRVGFSYASYGDTATGVPLIEQGIAKGGLKHPGDAGLHLGIAQFWAGQKDQAAKSFEAVADGDGSGDLAHLWLLLAKQQGVSN